MKRIFIAILLLISVVFCSPCFAAVGFYGATSLTGSGTGALDAIDGTRLADGAAAYVVTATGFYVYHLNASSGAAESSPDVISPDSNAGNKRWILVARGTIAVTDDGAGTVAVQSGTDTTTGFQILDADGGTPVLNVDTVSEFVGVGTSTPQSKLDVEGGVAIGATYSGTTAAPTNGAIIEGNVGIGNSALESWGTVFTVLQIGGDASLMGLTAPANNATFRVLNNAYYDQTDSRFEYISGAGTNLASMYQQDDGKHTFFTAPTGVADDPITWTTAQTITSAGLTQFGTASGAGQVNVTPSTSIIALNVQGGQIAKVTTVNAATYDLLTTDYILNVTYTATAAVTSLTLPTAQCVAGRIITIKDAGGGAGANTITIDTEGAETIDGAATFVLNTNYEAIDLYSDGSNWFAR